MSAPPGPIEIQDYDDFFAKEEIKEIILKEIGDTFLKRLKIKYLESRFLKNFAELFFQYNIETTKENIDKLLGSKTFSASVTKGKQKKFKQEFAKKDFLTAVEQAVNDNFKEINKQKFNVSAVTKDPKKLKEITNPRFVRNEILKALESILEEKSRENSK